MKYYYNNQWYSYEDLHNQFGITNTPAEDVTLYDTDLNTYNGWDFDNKTWVEHDSQWFSHYDLPYYRKQSDHLTAYLADQPLSLDRYTLHDSSSYDYSDSLYTYDYLYSNFGITTTPSRIYYEKYGVIKCWYNQDLQLYWDTDSAKWYVDPPRYDDSPIDVDDIDKVGAMALFLFTGNTYSRVQYGTLVSARQLKPMSMNFPSSGELNYSTAQNHSISGTWRLLSAVTKSSPTEPCIVLAIKVSDRELNITQQDNSNISNNSITPTNNYIETVEYNL